MSPGRDRRTTRDPLDDVYEIDLPDESPEDARLRDEIKTLDLPGAS